MEEYWAKELFKFIAQNNFQRGQIFSGYSERVVNIYELIDKIAEIRGISEEQNGEDYNSVIDELQEKA